MKGVEFVKQRLPDFWLVRELNPDYGLDIHVEVFDQLPDGSGSADALGEHFYAQVKGVHGAKKLTKTVHHRRNVAKFERTPQDGGEVAIEVIAFTLEVDELLTIEAMGAAVPALLFVADLDRETIYFLCLNDYITKVLLPDNPNYADQQKVTVHVPAWNVLDSDDDSFAYFWLLARRAKYYASFNQFVYQHVEMSSAVSQFSSMLVFDNSSRAQATPEVISMLTVFLRANLRLDIWTTSGPGYWAPLNDVRDGYQWLFENLITVEQPTDLKTVESYLDRMEQVMYQAANLGRMYEEVVREWRLPTALATLTDDHPGSKYRPNI